MQERGKRNAIAARAVAVAAATVAKAARADQGAAEAIVMVIKKSQAVSARLKKISIAGEAAVVVAAARIEAILEVKIIAAPNEKSKPAAAAAATEIKAKVLNVRAGAAVGVPVIALRINVVETDAVVTAAVAAAPAMARVLRIHIRKVVVEAGVVMMMIPRINQNISTDAAEIATTAAGATVVAVAVTSMDPNASREKVEVTAEAAATAGVVAMTVRKAHLLSTDKMRIPSAQDVIPAGVAVEAASAARVAPRTVRLVHLRRDVTLLAGVADGTANSENVAKAEAAVATAAVAAAEATLLTAVRCWALKNLW